MDKMEQNNTIGNIAVEGLLVGIVAGIAMVVYLVLVGLLAGQGISAPLARFAPTQPGSPLAGGFTHLAVSGVYGMLFGVLYQPLKKHIPNWLVGIGYGAVLFLVAEFALLPGSGSPLTEIPTLHFAVAHLIYGAVLGLRFTKQVG